MEKHVYFVRHGESDSNRGGIMRGPAATLTDKGREEAKVVAGRIERIGVSALISSPYERTMHTAEALAARINLPIEKSDLFIEWRRPSVMLGQSWKDPKMQQLDDEVLAGHTASLDYRHSDEESFTELKTRAENALVLLANHEAEKICVVTHGIFLRVICGLVMLQDDFIAADFKHIYRTLLTTNTGVTVFKYDNKYDNIARWRLITWNDSAHLG